jgi:hypothetical protein
MLMLMLMLVLVLVLVLEIPLANAQPAYAEGFGVAGAHMSRRSEAKEERRTSNAQWGEITDEAT